MTRQAPQSALRRFAAADTGAVMVEFAIVAALFFFSMFIVIDFGRLGFAHVGTEMAVRIAARTATVRPAACAGVPDRYSRGVVPDGIEAPRFGTSCKAAGYVCAAVATVTCAGVATNPTAQEIWTRIVPLMPNGTTIADLTFSYTYDQNLGYLGGPYVPMVTVTANVPQFTFISPLNLVGTALGPLALPGFSVSLPAEDLALGDTG